MNILQKLSQQNILFDSHAHLNSTIYDEDRDEVVLRAKGSGVEHILDIGVDIASSVKAVENARKYSTVSAFVGIDPEIFVPGSEMFRGFEINDKWLVEQLTQLEKLVLNNRDLVVGIGETGMDLFWLKKSGERNEEIIENSRKYQEKLFRMHLDLAQKHELPLSVHSRGAEKECLQIIKEYNATGIFHSYTGDYETAKGLIENGWALGLNGIATFKNTGDLRHVYKLIMPSVSDSHGNPLQQITPKDFYAKGIFFETDSPFLSPEGKRGQRNEPANVKDIWNYLINGEFRFA